MLYLKEIKFTQVSDLEKVKKKVHKKALSISVYHGK